MLQLPPFRYQTNNAAVYAGTALAPVAITSGTSFSAPENTTAVATMAATGGGTITWSLIGGADLAKFTIGSSSGVLTFNTAPDFETPTDADGNNIYLVQVQATNGVTSDTKSLSVTVTDVAETTLDLDFTAMSTLDPRITFSRASTATYFNSSGVLSTAASGAPRFDYDPVTHAPKGLLIEEGRTNTVLFSQEFDNASWVKTGVTVTVNSVAAPDGTTTADLITASATTANISKSPNPAQNYTVSIFIKKGTSDWVYMVGQATDAPKVWFNINTGAVGTVQAGFLDTGIQSIGNGWYRCWFADAPGTGAEPVTVGLCDADNSATVTVGRTIYLWGAMQESPAVFPCSYIPTTSVTVTRSADVATMTGTDFSSWYNTSVGTLVAEFDFLALSGFQRIITANNNGTSEVVQFYSNTVPIVGVSVTHLSGSIANIAVGTPVPLTAYKAGLSYALNDFAACMNGGTVSVDTSGTPATPTQLAFGRDTSPSNTNYINGHVRRLRSWNIRKTNAELQALTT